MLFLLYHSASQHYPKFKQPMNPATKWIEVTWPSKILQYHSVAAERFGEFLQNWFPYPRLRIPLSADDRDSATKTRAAARQNPWRVDLRLDPNTTSKTYKPLPKTTSPKNRTNHKACPPNESQWQINFDQKFGRSSKFLAFYFCKGFQQFDLQKATRLPQDLVWVFAAGKFTSDAEIYWLCASKHNGVYSLKRKLF